MAVARYQPHISSERRAAGYRGAIVRPGMNARPDTFNGTVEVITNPTPAPILTTAPPVAKALPVPQMVLEVKGKPAIKKNVRGVRDTYYNLY